MKVLFIGGTGNISTAVSRLCVEKGIDLYLLNRGKTKTEIRGAKSIIADVSVHDQLTRSLKEHRWDSVVDWIAFTENDIERDIAVFRDTTGQFVFISSASAYQKPPQNHVITESTPLENPFWEYSRNKIACENLLMRAFRERDFPVTIVRPSFTYDTVIPLAIGGWNEYTVVDRMKNGRKVIVHGDGTSLWTITHSEDFAKAFVGLLGNERSIGETYQITSDEVLTWNQIYETVAHAAGVQANMVHIASDFIVQCEGSLTGSLLGDKSYSAIFDNTKIKSLVPDFKATIPLSEGVKKTLAWFDADPKRKIVRAETNEMIDRIISLYERGIIENE